MPPRASRLRGRARLHGVGNDRGISAGPRRRDRSPTSRSAGGQHRRSRRGDPLARDRGAAVLPPDRSSTSMARAMFASICALAGGAVAAVAGPADNRAMAAAAPAPARTAWSDPAPPVQIFANTYLVGTCGIGVDPDHRAQGPHPDRRGDREAGPTVAANIQRLGFKLRDVKLIQQPRAYRPCRRHRRLQRLTGAERMPQPGCTTRSRPASRSPTIRNSARTALSRRAGRPHARRRHRRPARRSLR